MIFVDMDGVLAKWNSAASIEDTYQEGYFLERELEDKIKKLILMLKRTGEKVAILSAVYPTGTAKADKNYWLDLIGLPDVRRIFVPYGMDKHEFIPCLPEPMILLDDYSRNLHTWESAGFRGIKFYNGINGTKGSWKGAFIRNTMTVEEMYGVVMSVKYKIGNDKGKKGQ